MRDYHRYRYGEITPAVVSLALEGCAPEEIAGNLGLWRSAVDRGLQHGRAKGLLPAGRARRRPTARKSMNRPSSDAWTGATIDLDDEMRG